ncbi:hypothetical protein VTK56DRAFT_9925 [Thermocarpiscus australiensis]
MTATEAMEEGTSGNEAKASKSESKAKSKDPSGPVADEGHKITKRRRKVNHACVYCRRSHMTCGPERPCARCIARNIGHLCHDEPRDHESRKSKGVLATSTANEPGSQQDLGRSAVGQGAGSMGPPSFDSGTSNGPGQATKAAFDPAALAGRGDTLQLVQPSPVSGIQASTLAAATMDQFTGFPDPWLASQNHYHEMHSFHPVIAPEVTNEFSLLNDFLQASLFDESALLSDNPNPADSGSGFVNSSAMLPPSAVQGNAMLPPNTEQAKVISRPASALPTDKAREYYLQAADPTGNADPAERMEQLLQAKYKAGMLRPFNYVKGYARLSNYLDTHVAPASKQKILRQLDRFRPKFREKMKDLVDMDLVRVEMWFEERLMECDRVFASMAVPACCWRRTGEIFRGNKEMAELIKVPVEDLRGGKIALHEILTEESNVRYWEEFGTIAFDPAHDTLLTACSLKCPIDGVDHVVNCCFSFRIRTDDHKIPSLIIGNFLPHDPEPEQ